MGYDWRVFRGWNIAMKNFAYLTVAVMLGLCACSSNPATQDSGADTGSVDTGNTGDMAGPDVVEQDSTEVTDISVDIRPDVGTDTTDPDVFAFAPMPTDCVVGATCELAATITFSPVNPFDPDEIMLDAEFVAPGGATYKRPGFYFQDYINNDGAPGAATGDPDWRVRFLPTEVGVWRWRFVVTQNSDMEGAESSQTTSPWHEVTVAEKAPESNWHGILRPSTKDNRYMTFEDGAPYFPIGENLGWYNSSVTDYRTWMDKLAANKANFMRVWMATWGFSLEWSYPEGSTLGDYTLRMDRAWALDQVFSWAAERDIMLMLCAYSHGQFSTAFNSEWDTNPHNVINGGPLEKPQDFFTDAIARKLTQNRLRYIVARWGAEPALLAWELFNEVDLTDQNDAAILAEWHKTMAAELKRLDPYPHMVTTSTSGSILASLFGINAALYSLPEIDIAQVHYYGNDVVPFDVITDVKRLASETGYNKPVLFAELGVHSAGPAETMAIDPYFTGLHDLIWAPVFTPSAGSGMTWWWDNVIEPYDQYFRWKALADFVDGIVWDAENFIPAGYSATHTEKSLELMAISGRTSILVWIKNSADTFKAGGDDSTIEGATIDLGTIPTGTYGVRWFDTRGSEIFPGGPATVTRSETAFAIPTFSHDIALRLTLQP